jgi:hypothetical protein
MFKTKTHSFWFAVFGLRLELENAVCTNCTLYTVHCFCFYFCFFFYFSLYYTFCFSIFKKLETEIETVYSASERFANRKPKTANQKLFRTLTFQLKIHSATWTRRRCITDNLRMHRASIFLSRSFRSDGILHNTLLSVFVTFAGNQQGETNEVQYTIHGAESK